jgi:hypothetical protein
MLYVEWCDLGCKQVGLKSFVVSIDYRDYMSSSSKIWALWCLFLYLCSYNLVGSVTVYSLIKYWFGWLGDKTAKRDPHALRALWPGPISERTRGDGFLSYLSMTASKMELWFLHFPHMHTRMGFWKFIWAIENSLLGQTDVHISCANLGSLIRSNLMC